MIDMEKRTILSGLQGLRRSVAIAAVSAILGTAAPAFAQIIIAPNAPPPLRREVVPPPRPGMAWHGGRWRWNGHGWVWVPGLFVQVPRPGVRWVPGHWAHRPRGWVWVRGHWS